MKLNIYEGRKIVKTYEADTYDLMFGTMEDVAEAIDLDALETGTDTEILKMIGKAVMNSLDTFKDLLKDIFEGLTDEELKHTKVKDIISVLFEVVAYTVKQFSKRGDEKNETRLS